MRSRSSDRRIVGVLLALLVVECILLGWHMGFSFVPNVDRGVGTPAGFVARKTNDLRRRSLNSLVWDVSAERETLYYHDSVLTLKGSTAVLNLENKTEVVLSENTLVTIEPTGEKSGGEIRLRFARGGVSARNPFASARLEGESFSVNVAAGSDVDVRKVDDGEFEVALRAGSGVLHSAGGVATTLSGAGVVRIEGEKIDVATRDAQLKWDAVVEKRVYTHSGFVTLPLRWSGDPSRMVIQTLGKSERALDLAAGTHQAPIELELGQHRIWLRADSRTSEALDVEVWRAPVLHLLAPLPRNRVKTGDRVEFVWMRQPGIQEYLWSASGNANQVRERVGENVFTHSFSTEDDVEWRVDGVDGEGFKVPALYSYPLFLRQDPLAAPVLKKPSLRKPASGRREDRGASLWRILSELVLPRAHADADVVSFSAVFAWEPVTGADHYVIEIAERADFRDPVVMTTVKRGEYVWRGFKRQVYYWRVAAGSRGRLGVFSEPARVDFSADLSSGEVDGIALRADPPVVNKAEPEPPAEPVKIPEPPAEVKSLAPAVLTDVRPRRSVIFWKPRYMFVRETGAERIDVELAGVAPGAVLVEAFVPRNEGRTLRIDAEFASFAFTPEPESRFVLQRDLKWQTGSLRALWGEEISRWSYGVVVQKGARFERESYEQVRVTEDWGAGVEAEGSWMPGRFVLVFAAGARVSGSGQGAVSRLEVRRSVWRLQLGVGTQAEWTLLKSGSHLGLGAIGFAGFEF